MITKHVFLIDDEDPKRKALVRNKLDKYLSRAESLHGQLLSPTTSYASLKGEHNLSTSPITSPQKGTLDVIYV